MRASERIRKLLRENKDGLSIKEICYALGMFDENVRMAIWKMPDAYIDRWVYTDSRGPASSIWCVVPVPENAPRPRGRTAEERAEANRRNVANYRKRSKLEQPAPTPEPEPAHTFAFQGLTQIRGPWPTHH